MPDFRLLLPTPDGPKNCLAELKVISAGKTWYPRGTLGKGADRRADRLPAEYERTLRDLDARFLGAPAGPDPGPLVTRFLVVLSRLLRDPGIFRDPRSFSKSRFRDSQLQEQGVGKVTPMVSQSQKRRKLSG